MSKPIEPYAWWKSLYHEGLLITPQKMYEFFPSEIPPINSYLQRRLRKIVQNLIDEKKVEISTIADILLQDLLQITENEWLKGPEIDSSWIRYSLTGERVKPWRIWQNNNQTVLPVFLATYQKGKKREFISRLGVGRGKKAVTRVVEWLRKAGFPYAVVTNGSQWRLIFAGSDYHASCQWDLTTWFDSGSYSPQVDAFRILLSPENIISESKEHCTLYRAILSSRESQGELSNVLGERIRKAIEIFISSSHRVLSVDDMRDESTHQAIYTAAMRIIMRMVVILFAEARDLLPRSSLYYANSYSLEYLHEVLVRRASSSTRRLRETFGAWLRIVSLFRLIYYGSPHQMLPVPPYGGELFEPGDYTSKDPIKKYLGYFELENNWLSDEIMYNILQLITRSAIKIKQGKSWKTVSAPVDFSDLSSEYIGILYEGLLDFELRAAIKEPVIFLNVGNQPALPFSRLQQMSGKDMSQLLKELKNEASTGDTTEEELEENKDITTEEEPPEEQEEAQEGIRTSSDEEAIADERAEWSESVYSWAREIVKEAGIVKTPSKKAGAIEKKRWEAKVDKAADDLIKEVALPGDWYLIRWGGTRKGRGTFYTPPGLTAPTIRRTLKPKLYHEDDKGVRLKKPEDILTIKVCDPAMGSGSFLIAALRYITETLAESLSFYSRIGKQSDCSIIRLADGKDSESISDELPKVTPDHERFDELLKARLKRHVVERCLYGVDIDPLAVELARLSLWVETMDRDLPFGFLDHKLKVGNSLVGAWLDRFEEYPVMAWEREGGDKNYSTFVNHYYLKKMKNGKEVQAGDVWTKAIKQFRNEHVKPNIKNWLEGRKSSYVLGFYQDNKSAEELHDEAMRQLELIHNIPVHETEKKRHIFIKLFQDNPSLNKLKEAMDTWCALWFWPPEELKTAPLPQNFLQPSKDAGAIVRSLARKHGFFHWEFEFPDVFSQTKRGFDVVLGNPPWETQKPNSKEFFSNRDPLYRTYGKQEALRKQKELFKTNPEIERQWVEYNSIHKAMSNWTKHTASPFGDPDDPAGTKFPIPGGKSGDILHAKWRDIRSHHRGYADREHPFRYQGSGDINTYKMFLETSFRLLNSSGRLGMVVPGAVYSDYGSGLLRDLFVGQASWEWLFSFENRKKIFDIDGRYKFCVTIVDKSGTTRSVKTSFMHRELEPWLKAENHIESYHRKQIEAFSPNSKSFLEIRTQRDLQLLEKIYSNSVLLGDESEKGWGIKYSTEFHMTNDSHLFSPLPKWEESGYVSDEYGHWLQGKWYEYNGPQSVLQREHGLVLSRDGKMVINVADIADVALPLYEGRMIGQFDFSQKGWVSGKGRSAVWREIPWEEKQIEPQYLMGREKYFSEESKRGLKVGFLAVGSSTNSRTMITSIINDMPCGNSIGVLTSKQKSSDYYNPN